MFFHYLTVVALKFEHPFKFASVSSTHLCKTWLKIVLHLATCPIFLFWIFAIRGLMAPTAPAVLRRDGLMTFWIWSVPDLRLRSVARFNCNWSFWSLIFPPGLVTAWSLLPFYPWPGAKQAGDRRRSASRRSSYFIIVASIIMIIMIKEISLKEVSLIVIIITSIITTIVASIIILAGGWMSRRPKKSVPRRSYVHRPNIDDCFDRNFDCWLISWL